MSRFPLPLAIAACLLGGAASAEFPDQWAWTLEAAPSVFSPRMHGLDNALSYQGINALDRAWTTAGAQEGAKVQTGFAKVEWGFGGRVAISREFNEDIRGGLFLDFSGVWKSDKQPFLTDSSTYISGTMTISSSTMYSVNESISLPFLTIGVFMHKIFRYEEEPALRTYIGGWGAYGSLVGASISGQFKRASDSVSLPFRTDLTAEGWSAGGLGGIEYAVAKNLAIYGETGFQWCIVQKVQYQPQEGGSGRLATSDNTPLSLDYGGFFIRAGVKLALAGGN